MRRILLGLMICSALGAAAVEMPENVVYKHPCYGLRVSLNGKWLANYSGYAKVYDVDNDVMTEYANQTLSIGNCITNDGVALAGGNFLKDGEVIPARTADGQGGFDMEGISADGKHVTGQWRGAPFKADVDENFNLVDVVSLPRPTLDLFETRPQWVQAYWISGDGETVAGQIQDGYGMYLYPIIFYNTPDGWTYTIPIEDVFNPDGVEILQNPNDHQPPYPYPDDYMNDANRGLYQEAYKQYVAGNGVKPDPAKFMTAEQYEEYLAAVDAYNEWYDSNKENFNNFLNNYYAIVESSPSFSSTELAISPSGEYIYMNGGIYNSYGSRTSYMYEFTKDGINRTIKLKDGMQAPNQVLTDGTLLSTPPMTGMPTGYILLPGSDEFMSIQDYLLPEYHDLVVWMEESFPGGVGVISLNDEKTRLFGSVFILQLSDELYEEADYRFATYVVDLTAAGIESIEAEGITNEEELRIYNLQGIRLDKPVKGLNIINGKKVIIR